MAEAGIPIEQIAQYMGHNPGITFRTYARYKPGYLQHAASAISERLGRGATSEHLHKNKLTRGKHWWTRLGSNQ